MQSADTSPASTVTYPSVPFWTLRRVRQDPLALLDSLSASGDDIVPFRLGRRQAFLLNHPAHVEEVLVRQSELFVKGRGFDRARRLLGNGLLTADEPLHETRRRLIQPAFHRQHLTAYAQTVARHAERLSDRWRPGVTIDVGRAMRELTLGVIGETLFGTDLAPHAEEIEQAVDAALPSMDGLIALVAPIRRASRARCRLDSIVDTLIAERRAATDPPEDLLTLLMAVDHDSTAGIHQLRDDIVTLMLAGHDTISHALTWTWTLLASHPDVEARLGKELDQMSGLGLPPAERLPHLEYSKCVLAESLRLLPPAWVIVRWASVACRLGGAQIPAGSIIVASPYAIQRSARFFHNPLTFDPSRWPTPSTEARLPGARLKLAFFPFGAGPRACVGEGFAWMEGTLALATLARRWRLVPAWTEPVPGQPQITLRPARPVLMTPEMRTAGYL